MGERVTVSMEGLGVEGAAVKGRHCGKRGGLREAPPTFCLRPKWGDLPGFPFCP